MAMISQEEMNILDQVQQKVQGSKKASAFLRLQAGEEAICQFRILDGGVQSNYNEMFEKDQYRFIVKNLSEDPTGGLEQTFDLGKTWGNRIMNYLREGVMTLKVKRVGSTKEDTDYLVIPAPTP